MRMALVGRGVGGAEEKAAETVVGGGGGGGRAARGQAHGGRGRGAEGLGNFGRELSPSCAVPVRSPGEEFSGGVRSGVWLSRPDSAPFCAASRRLRSSVTVTSCSGGCVF